MFARRHYQMIADILIGEKPSTFEITARSEARGDQWRETVEAFAERFRVDNSRFDEAKFLKACGYTKE